MFETDTRPSKNVVDSERTFKRDRSQVTQVVFTNVLDDNRPPKTAHPVIFFYPIYTLHITPVLKQPRVNQRE